MHAVEAFVADPEPLAGQADWPALLPAPVDAVIDACDAPRAKLMLAAWALRERHTPLVIAGAAGGKRQAQRVEVDDLARVTHDPLLASLRQRLRKQHGAAGTGRIGLCCVYSSESVQRPAIADAACELDAPMVDGSLNCPATARWSPSPRPSAWWPPASSSTGSQGKALRPLECLLALWVYCEARWVVSSVGRAADF